MSANKSAMQVNLVRSHAVGVERTRGDHLDARHDAARGHASKELLGAGSAAPIQRFANANAVCDRHSYHHKKACAASGGPAPLRTWRCTDRRRRVRHAKAHAFRAREATEGARDQASSCWKQEGQCLVTVTQAMLGRRHSFSLLAARIPCRDTADVIGAMSCDALKATGRRLR